MSETEKDELIDAQKQNKPAAHRAALRRQTAPATKPQT